MIALLAVTVGAAVFFLFPVSMDSTPENSVLFTVTPGSSVRAISVQLAEQKLVKSAFVFFLLARLESEPIKAGTYRIQNGSGARKILAALVSGKQEYLRVTIPEGLSLLKIARYLEESGVVKSDEFLEAAGQRALLDEYGIPGVTAEGYLFPDTYFFSYQNQGLSVVRTMLNNFFERVQQIPGAPQDKALLHQKVILASIIEREYRIPAEAPKIASVFDNRLKIGMGLQSCATIEYILTEIQGLPHPTRLSTAQLSIPSDYNTYLWAGLPPGPISSPGRIALEASFNPDQTKYLYFRLIDAESGAHFFSRTLEEHATVGRDLTLKQAALR